MGHPGRHTSQIGRGWGVLLALGLLIAFTGRAVWAQSASTPTRSDTTVEKAERRHPNEIPYRTDRSFVYHVLATPAYILHGVTRPIGWGMIWVERNFPGLFERKRPVYGAFPILEIGGPAGASGGIMAYHRDVFGEGHAIRLKALFGSRDYNEFGVTYKIPDVFGPKTQLTFRSHYFNSPEDRFFPGGNASGRANETRYSIEQADTEVRFDYEPPRTVWGHLALRYEHSIMGRAEFNEGEAETPIPVGTPGLGTADRFSAQASVIIDGTRGRPRILSGTRLKLGGEYAHEFDDDRFHYLRYRAELHQFVPVPVLPPTRRVALRVRLTQIEALDSDVIPFYALSRLGGQETLRGFVTNRFSGEGSLLLNLEYRYPIWKQMDAVFFFDAGQVFDAVDEVALDRFHTGAGGGIHFLGSGGLAFRVEVARSAEETRAILTIQPLF